jgi:hypothetical protein
MKRKALIAFFALGTLGGFSSGIFHMAHACHHRHDRRAAFERHVAQVCVDAAAGSRAKDRAAEEAAPR